MNALFWLSAPLFYFYIIMLEDKVNGYFVGLVVQQLTPESGPLLQPGFDILECIIYESGDLTLNSMATAQVHLDWLVSSAEAAEAIKCWVCRSDADPRCVDPFDNKTLPITDCDVKKLAHYPGLKATMCRKVRQKVYGNWRFIRSCAFLGTPGEGTGDENFCTMRTGTYNVFIETCTCNSKDGCNTAVKMTCTSFYLYCWSILLLHIIHKHLSPG